MWDGSGINNRFRIHQTGGTPGRNIVHIQAEVNGKYIHLQSGGTDNGTKLVCYEGRGQNNEFELVNWTHVHAPHVDAVGDHLVGLLRRDIDAALQLGLGDVDAVAAAVTKISGLPEIPAEIRDSINALRTHLKLMEQQKRATVEKAVLKLQAAKDKAEARAVKQIEELVAELAREKEARKGAELAREETMAKNTELQDEVLSLKGVMSDSLEHRPSLEAKIVSRSVAEANFMALLNEWLHVDFAELRHVWLDAKEEPCPVARKPAGAAPGAIYQVTLDDGSVSRWIGKPGISAGLERQTSSIPAINLVLRGGNLNAIQEKAASDAYLLFSGRNFIVPAVRLHSLPVLNEFTRHNVLVTMECGIIWSLNHYQDPVTCQLTRRPGPAITDTVHVMSQFIEGYKDLHDIQAWDELSQEEVTVSRYIHDRNRPPIEVVIEERHVPLEGVMEMLAAARLIGDRDVLGNSFKNAGVIIERENGAPTRARAVKIDPGLSFCFQDTLFFKSHNPEGQLLDDLKDIEYGTNGLATVFRWDSFTEMQKRVFLGAMKRDLQILDIGDAMELILHRGGHFNRGCKGGEERVKRRVVEQMKMGWMNFVRMNRVVFDPLF